jgi:hypothetical protein
VDKARLEALKKALAANGASEKTEGTVLEFYSQKENEWKAEKPG